MIVKKDSNLIHYEFQIVKILKIKKLSKTHRLVPNFSKGNTNRKNLKTSQILSLRIGISNFQIKLEELMVQYLKSKKLLLIRQLEPLEFNEEYQVNDIKIDDALD